MTECIRNTKGTIGYIDAGHGWEEGLTEIELENRDGYFVSSYDSFNSGGTGVAATKATLDITSFDESFSSVHLLDQVRNGVFGSVFFFRGRSRGYQRFLRIEFLTLFAALVP